MYIFLINKQNIYMNKKIIISLTCLFFSCNLILFFAYLFTPNDNLNKPNYIEYIHITMLIKETMFI